ncbi:MAG: IS30 family transposase [Gemmatimonadaceae bacterium]|jgi:IS30 family transposase
MTQSRGLRYRPSGAELEALWHQRKKGESLQEIAKALGMSLSAVYGIVARQGGIPPRRRRRSRRALSLAEREEISRQLVLKSHVRVIARLLGRAPSTISREIHRHGGQIHYRAARADAEAWRRAQRPKPCRLAQHATLRRVVAEKLAAAWAPQQIAGWLVREYPNDPTMRVSHETIYRTLYVQARGVLKKQLMAHLRRQRTMRRARAGMASRPGGRAQIVDAVSISERPPSVEDRAVPGHWEGDLLAGAKNSHIATLVERRSRYVHLVKVEGKDTASVVSALIREVQRLPKGLMASLTWDRGMEMAQHQLFSVVTDVEVYFCDPRSPWQRGSNENTNGLLRQYFPHGTDLRPFTQRQLDKVAQQLNTRPRQTLEFQTPAVVLAATVASTG